VVVLFVAQLKLALAVVFVRLLLIGTAIRMLTLWLVLMRQLGSAVWLLLIVGLVLVRVVEFMMSPLRLLIVVPLWLFVRLWLI